MYPAYYTYTPTRLRKAERNFLKQGKNNRPTLSCLDIVHWLRHRLQKILARGSRQSYDCELRRRRCKKLLRHDKPSAFEKQIFSSALKNYSSLLPTTLAFYL
jgi:hypothetical protein